MDTLQLISRLRTELDAGSDDAIWTTVGLIASSVEWDERATKHERELVRQLKSSASDLFVAKRNHLNNDTHRVGVTISALESSIKRRSIGPDGWPMA